MRCLASHAVTPPRHRVQSPSILLPYPRPHFEHGVNGGFSWAFWNWQWAFGSTMTTHTGRFPKNVGLMSG